MSALAVDDSPNQLLATTGRTQPLHLVVNQNEISMVAVENYADLLSALSLGPLSRPFIDTDGGLRFEWQHVDAQGDIWNLAAVIEASGGLYMVALSPHDAIDDDELFLEKFDAIKLIRFVVAGSLASLK